MTDEEFMELDGESEGVLAFAFAAEHAGQDDPAETVLMHRQHKHYTEVLWIRAYRAARCIVLTFPPIEVEVETGVRSQVAGTVRHVPFGHGPDAMTRAMQREVRISESVGWEAKNTAVYSADPWDVTSTMDDRPTL